MVAITFKGKTIIRNFLYQVCGCRGDWKMGSFVAEEIARIRKQVGDERVILGLSGGVDSSVAAVLLHRAIGKRLTCIFVNNGLLRKDDEYGVLSLTQASYQLLSGKLAFEGTAPVKDALPVKASRIRQSEDYDTTLFERLRAKRKALADKAGIPPYIIFSDKSLIDMCQRRPQTKAEFAEVFGVGQQKLARYSAIFMRVINGG